MRLSSSNERVIKRGPFTGPGNLLELRGVVNLWPMTGSVHKGLNEHAHYGNFLAINIFHFSSVVSNALVME